MSGKFIGHALVCALLLVLLSTVAGSVVGPAFAQPGDAELTDPPAGSGEASTTLAWPSLGVNPSLDLYPDSTSRVSVPLPAGLTAARLQGLILTPMNIAAGYLEISDGDGRLVTTVDLPPAASGGATTPFDVDISAVRADASSVDLAFTVRALDGADRVCGPVQRLRLTDLATVFTGAQPPITSIADFFSPVLERVTIYAPVDAGAAEQQAVLGLTSTLARLYNPLPLDIAVVSQPRGALPPPGGGLTRAIVVEAGPPGLSVENSGTPDAYLRVSGEGDGLSNQLSLLVTKLQPVAQATTASVEQAGADAGLDGDTLTFSQLKVREAETDVIRTGSLRVSIDRTTMGARFDGVQVHLLADYTPVPDGDAASVVIRSQDIVVYRSSLDGSGVLDATFNLDSQMLDQQWITLDLALTYTPDQTCGPLITPIAFQIDPRSTLTLHRGGPPLGGFTAFPYEFSPNFVVALDGSGPDQLSYAARVVAAIARLTRAELMPQVVDLQAAAEADTGALIVANAEAVRQTPLNPPVAGDGSIVNFGLPTELRVDIDGGLGSIQAFADPPRNRSVVLVTTTGDWALVDPLFSRIDGVDGDWSQLTGDVLAAGLTGNPTNVAIRPAADIFEPTQPDTSNPWLVAGIVGGVLALIAALVAALLMRRRSSRGSLRSDGAHSADHQ